jgi:uncharacterized protein (TIGR02217 family)
MSNAVFPVLPGLMWSVVKTPQWSTRIQKTVSGRESRAAFYSLPLWTFKLSYEVLRANTGQELQQLVGFFNARQGSFDTFLYADPSDNAVTAAVFGAGDGTTKKFQLLRPMGGYSEPILAPNGTPNIYANAVLQGGVTIDANTGVVTFATAPGAGVTLTWTGGFYYRVRFLQDSMDFNNFLKDLWEAKKVEFVSVK